MLPIKLITSYGIEQFDVLFDQFQHYSDLGLREEFKGRCAEDLEVQENYLQFFLDDDIMSRKYKMNEEDVDGWRIFNSQHDLCSALKHFAGKAY